jgi:hypothetical protein
MRRLLACSSSRKKGFFMRAATASAWSQQRTLCGARVAAALAALGICGSGWIVAAQQPPVGDSGSAAPAAPLVAPMPDLPAKGQETFFSAHAAVDALVSALKQNDNDALAKMLGPDAQKLLSSGDATEDERNRQQFLEKYGQMHRMVTEENGLTTLFVGAENWPTPLPLAHRGHLWYFDTPAGEKEVLYRRIGENELTVIKVCDELVAAEKEYDAQPRDGSSVRQYAQRVLSAPGKENGLYWQTASGGAESPLGPLLASAEAEGYPQDRSWHLTPFNGYYFRILKSQGPDAPGGARSYLSGGKMTGGFAFVAYPAGYRSSGVMTFIVDDDGVVYQKDLGPKTEQIAKSMAAFNPDHSWTKAD